MTCLDDCYCCCNRDCDCAQNEEEEPRCTTDCVCRCNNYGEDDESL